MLAALGGVSPPGRSRKGRKAGDSALPRFSEKQKVALYEFLREELGSQSRDDLCEKLDITPCGKPTCKYFCTQRTAKYDIIGCTSTATKDGFCSRHKRCQQRYEALERFFSARLMTTLNEGLVRSMDKLELASQTEA